MKRAAVAGLAIAGRAVARALVARGVEVRLADDRPAEEHRALADELGAELVEMGTPEGRTHLLADADVLVPAPGIPPTHPLIVEAIARGIPVRSEIDLAHDWEARRPGGARPCLGVTGTDGKTTTTRLVAHLVESLGLRAAEVGNTDVPFVAALDSDAEVFVVECSSFRLQWTRSFRCESSVWLNIAPDHLDWHGTMEEYTAAKARLWAHVSASDSAVAPLADEGILAEARRSGARVVTFGTGEADYRREGEWLAGPRGRIMAVGDLWRGLPHDVSNSLAALAVVCESRVGDGSGALAGALSSFVPPRHRIEFVLEREGTRWFDDSKATSPHAALAAIRGFDRVVLVAGGRNKDLDLRALAAEPARMAGVVAIGESAPLVAEAFVGTCPVVTAGSMREAVRAAAALATPGVDVLLSPGCASFDWYDGYASRGDDFQNCVRELAREEAGR